MRLIHYVLKGNNNKTKKVHIEGFEQDQKFSGSLEQVYLHIEAMINYTTLEKNDLMPEQNSIKNNVLRIEVLVKKIKYSYSRLLRYSRYSQKKIYRVQLKTKVLYFNIKYYEFYENK